MAKTIFRIEWDNGHAAGVFPEMFEIEEAAEMFGRNWHRAMCAVDGDDPDGDDCPYSYEVIETELPDEDDIEEAAAAEEQSLDYFNRYIAGDR